MKETDADHGRLGGRSSRMPTSTGRWQISRQAPKEWQAFITSQAWGTWARPGLGWRERSFLVLAMTVVLGRMEEFRLHLSGARRNGISDDEIDEMVIQIAAYAGVPAGVAARRAVKEFRANEGSPEAWRTSDSTRGRGELDVKLMKTPQDPGRFVLEVPSVGRTVVLFGESDVPRPVEDALDTDTALRPCQGPPGQEWTPRPKAM